MNTTTFTAIKKSFFISLAYVGSGTIALLMMCSGMNDPGDFVDGLMTIILLLTIPVTCISFAFVYSEKHPVGAVLFIQSIMFLLFWLILFFIFDRKNKLDTN
jgi:hypothetical protein